MNAIHWVRSRQEERELGYWLSYAAYNQDDPSLNNRIYLLYLVVFFSIWIFVTLTFFASGAANFLRIIQPADPSRAAVLLETLVLGVWSLVSLWQTLKRSPITFSEEDALLICQTPVSRRHLTLRWLPMPWIKSAVPFWLLAVALGFSLAEISLPDLGVNRIPEYAGFGLRAWLSIVPVHLALYGLTWIVGVYRLQKDIERRWLAWPVMITATAFVCLLLFSMSGSASALGSRWNSIAGGIVFPLRAGFGNGSLAAALLVGWGLSAAMLGILSWVSGCLSLSRAAQETQQTDTVNTAMRYGFTSYANELKAKRRLGLKREASWLPARPGPAVLIWKDLLQTQRAFQLSNLFEWVSLFGAMTALALLPDPASRALVIAIWVIQIGKLSVVRIRSDLSRWPIFRQLPISPRKMLLYDLFLTYLLTGITSFAGLATGSIISRTPLNSFGMLLPGLVAAVAGMTVVDVIRQCRSSLLLNGSVPEVSAGGVLLAVLFVSVPYLVHTLLPGWIGPLLSIPISIFLGWFAFYLAVRSYRNVGGD